MIIHIYQDTASPIGHEIRIPQVSQGIDLAFHAGSKGGGCDEATYRIVAAIAVAVAIQFLGGGLLKAVDAGASGPTANGNAGGSIYWTVLQIRWTTVIPLILCVSAVVCLARRTTKHTTR